MPRGSNLLVSPGSAERVGLGRVLELHTGLILISLAARVLPGAVVSFVRRGPVSRSGTYWPVSLLTWLTPAGCSTGGFPPRSVTERSHENRISRGMCVQTV